MTPDHPATVALRRICRARKDLVAHRVALANQLRAHLRNVFPGAVGLFADLHSPISLMFLTRFDCQDRADCLTPKRLATWLSGVSYSGRTDPAVLHARLTAAPRGAVDDDGSAHAHITRALLAALRTLVEQIKLLTEQIGEQLAGHADAHIFTSLPRSGTVRAARLLAEIGDCRARFPTPSRWPASPASPPPHASPARPEPSDFVGLQTNSSAMPSPTSRAIPATRTSGPPTSTAEPSPAGTTTPMPSASSPAPGCSSSGTAGRTTSPTNRTNTAPSND